MHSSSWGLWVASGACHRARIRATRWLAMTAGRASPRSVVLNDRPEQLPALAVELHHLQLLVDAIVGRRGVADDTGQRQIKLNVLQAGGLLQDVVAGEIVAALLQDLDQK